MWPTPNVPNGGRKPKGGMSRTGMTADGKKRQVGLENAVTMWPTPNTAPDRPCEGNVRMLRSKVLNGEMAEAEEMLNGKSVFEAQGKLEAVDENEPTPWQTPRAARGGYTRDKGKKGAERLTLEGQAAKWPTPTSRDSKDKDAANRGGGQSLCEAVRSRPLKRRTGKDRT